MTPKNAILNHPRNKNVRFYEDEHKYEVYNESTGEWDVWPGITSWIKEFQEPFDKEGISKFVARRDGRTQQEVLDEWAEKGRVAIEYGNRVHKIAEDLINDGVVLEDDEDYDALEEAIKDIDFDPIVSEWVIWDDRIGRCSAVDFLSWDREREMYVIKDFKTNKEINFEPYKGKRLHFPIQDLPDSKYWVYALQLNIYRKILVEKYDLPVARDMYILHIREGEYEWIPILDLGHLVDKMYEYHEKFDS